MDPITPPEPPSAASQTPAGRSWYLIPLLAVLLGLTAAWAVHERHARHQLTGRIDAQVRHTTFLEARTADLLRLLAQSDTQVIRLAGNGMAENNAAIVIWNPRRAEGFVYTDLPGSLRLVAASSTQAGDAELIRFNGAVRPAPFHLPAGMVARDIRFFIADADPVSPPGDGQVLFLTSEVPDTF